MEARERARVPLSLQGEMGWGVVKKGPWALLEQRRAGRWRGCSMMGSSGEQRLASRAGALHEVGVEVGYRRWGRGSGGTPKTTPGSKPLPASATGPSGNFSRQAAAEWTDEVGEG